MDPAPESVFPPVARRWLVWPAVLALVLVALELTTDSDRAITRLVFDRATGVFPARNDFWIEVVMHHWAKYAVITLGFLVLGGLLLSYVLPTFAAHRRVL